MVCGVGAVAGLLMVLWVQEKCNTQGWQDFRSVGEETLVCLLTSPQSPRSPHIAALVHRIAWLIMAHHGSWSCQVNIKQRQADIERSRRERETIKKVQHRARGAGGMPSTVEPSLALRVLQL